MRRRAKDPPGETARPSPFGLRLGLFEYILLGLIALGIAITFAMALLNP